MDQTTLLVVFWWSSRTFLWTSTFHWAELWSPRFKNLLDNPKEAPPISLQWLSAVALTSIFMNGSEQLVTQNVKSILPPSLPLLCCSFYTSQTSPEFLLLSTQLFLPTTQKHSCVSLFLDFSSTSTTIIASLCSWVLDSLSHRLTWTVALLWYFLLYNLV